MPAGPCSPRLSYALSQAFSRRWWGVSLAVLVISLGLARLGIWRLDRLAERRARSATLEARLAAPPLLLSPTGLSGKGCATGRGAALISTPGLPPGGAAGELRLRPRGGPGQPGQAGAAGIPPPDAPGAGGGGPPPPTPPGGAGRPGVLVPGPPGLPGAAQSPQDWAPLPRPPGAGSDGSAVVQVTGWVRPHPAGPPGGPPGAPCRNAWWPTCTRPPSRSASGAPSCPCGGAGAGRGAPGPHTEGSGRASGPRPVEGASDRPGKGCSSASERPRKGWERGGPALPPGAESRPGGRGARDRPCSGSPSA